mmetsp:Transcript_31983/g.68101  ORF Transcript_31983/g.68101 Transcript_31983/m.68101 type:complete len:458 (+) Transcript_31983:101-1474(+)
MPIADIDYREYFPPEKQGKLQRAFKKFDADGSGEIGDEELHAMFKSLGMKMSLEQVQEVMKKVDYDGSGQIEFEEFCVLHIKLSHARPRADLIDFREYLDEATIKTLHRLFEEHDPQLKGAISYEDILKIRTVLNSKATDEDVRKVLKDADKGGLVGGVEFERLCALWAVVNKKRKRINYREYFWPAQVASLKELFDDAESRCEGGLGGANCAPLKALLKKCGLTLRTHEVQELVKEFDSDGSGDIDFEEFAIMVLRLRGGKRKRAINPKTYSCSELWNEEQFTIQELIRSGFGLEEFKMAGIPAQKLHKEGDYSALEFRHAGYTATELRRCGLGASELRKSGFGLAELRNAGFSDSVLWTANRAIGTSLSTGDLTVLPATMRPVGEKAHLQHTPSLPQIGARLSTPMIREHVDWRPALSRKFAARRSTVDVNIPKGEMSNSLRLPVQARDHEGGLR